MWFNFHWGTDKTSVHEIDTIFLLQIRLPTDFWRKPFSLENYICCSSIFAFGTIFSEPVQNFWTSKKFFEPVQNFWTSTKYFELGTFELYPPSSSPLYLPHLLLYLNAYLVSLEPQTFGFPLDSCPDALPLSHEDLDASSPIFFITYTQQW